MDSTPVFLSNGGLGEFFEDYTNKPLVGILEDLDAWCTNGLKGILFYFILAHYYIPWICIGLTQEKKSVQ